MTVKNKPLLKDFSLKFIDVMIGIVLGIGFQWWPNLNEPWQYVAFIFVYLNIVDYWIDYSPTIKKFPLKREIDVILHTFIVFSMFYVVFSTQQDIITSFFAAFIIYRILDIIWIWRMRSEYNPSKHDNKFMTAWNLFDWIEVLFAIILSGIYIFAETNPLLLILIFVFFRILTRIMASLRYKEIYYS